MGRKCCSSLVGNVLYHIKMLLIATYNKPNNDGLLFYCRTRSPLWMDFVVTTSLWYIRDTDYFPHFCSSLLACWLFRFLLVASCGASYFCPFYQERRNFSHYLLWARTGKMNVCLRGRGLLWMVSISHDSSPRVRPFCYHKQQWGSISKKGGELLGRQLSVCHNPLLCQAPSVVWDGNTVGSTTLCMFSQPSSPSLSPLNWPLLACTDRFLVNSCSSLRSYWIIFMRPSWTYVPVLGMSILATTTNSTLPYIMLNCGCLLSLFATRLASMRSPIYICHIHIPKIEHRVNQWELKKEFWSML